jgi:hypothetical protein
MGLIYRGAKLIETDLERANLMGAVITQEQLRGVKSPKPPQDAPGFRHGQECGVPCLGLGHRGYPSLMTTFSILAILEA